MANASCNCAAPYVPAGRRAEEAVKANPRKSDRAIAAELGVGQTTVRRARKSGAPNGAPGTNAAPTASAPASPPEKRLGRDNKYSGLRAPTRAAWLTYGTLHAILCRLKQIHVASSIKTF